MSADRLQSGLQTVRVSIGTSPDVVVGHADMLLFT